MLLWAITILLAAVVGGVAATLIVSWLFGPQVMWAPSSAAVEIDRLAGAIATQPPESRLSPAALLRKRWHMPSEIAREVGQCIDYVMRDFVMAWFNINDAGFGISNDPAFLEIVQYTLANVVGNVLFRLGHVNPLVFIFDDAAEALRQHVHWYGEMRRRAAANHPDVFAPLRDEALLEEGRRRRGLFAAAAAKQAAMATADAGAAPPHAVQEVAQDDASIIAEERRFFEEQQERAIVAEYALAGVLHPACDVMHASLLGAQPSPLSYASVPIPTGPVTPPTLAQQQNYLRGVASQILSRVLPAEERSSQLLVSILREILACKILQPAIANGEPDTINFGLNYLFTTVLATDPGVPGAVEDGTNEGNTAAQVASTTTLGGTATAPAAASGTLEASPLDLYLPVLPAALTDFDGLGGTVVSEAMPSANADVGAGPTMPQGDPGWRYFAGPITRTEAEALLARAPPGSFLLRAKEGGTVVLSYVTSPATDPVPPEIASADAAATKTGAGRGGDGCDVRHSVVFFNGQTFSILQRAQSGTLSAALRSARDIVWIGAVVQPVDAQSDSKPKNSLDATNESSSTNHPSRSAWKKPNDAISVAAPESSNAVIFSSISSRYSVQLEHLYAPPTTTKSTESVRQNSGLFGGFFAGAKRSKSTSSSEVPSPAASTLAVAARGGAPVGPQESGAGQRASSTVSAVRGATPNPRKHDASLFSSLAPLLNLAVAKTRQRFEEQSLTVPDVAPEQPLQQPASNRVEGADDGWGIDLDSDEEAELDDDEGGGSVLTWHVPREEGGTGGSKSRRRKSSSLGFSTDEGGGGGDESSGSGSAAEDDGGGGDEDEREADDRTAVPVANTPLPSQPASGVRLSSTSSKESACTSAASGSSDGAAAARVAPVAGIQTSTVLSLSVPGRSLQNAADAALTPRRRVVDDAAFDAGRLFGSSDSDSDRRERASGTDAVAHQKDNGIDSQHLHVLKEADRIIRSDAASGGEDTDTSSSASRGVGRHTGASRTLNAGGTPIAVPLTASPPGNGLALPPGHSGRGGEFALATAHSALMAKHMRRWRRGQVRRELSERQALAKQLGVSAGIDLEYASDDGSLSVAAAAAAAAAAERLHKGSDVAASERSAAVQGSQRRLLNNAGDDAEVPQIDLEAAIDAIISGESATLGRTVITASATSATALPIASSFPWAAGLAAPLVAAAAEPPPPSVDDVLNALRPNTCRPLQRSAAGRSIAAQTAATPAPVLLEARVTRPSVQVSRHESGKAPATDGVVIYLIEVRCRTSDAGGLSWALKQRYSELLELHRIVRDSIGVDFKGKFPPKTPFLLTGRFDGEFLRGRQVALDAWLQALLACPRALDSREVREFFVPSSRTTPVMRWSDTAAVADRPPAASALLAPVVPQPGIRRHVTFAPDPDEGTAGAAGNAAVSPRVVEASTAASAPPTLCEASDSAAGSRELGVLAAQGLSLPPALRSQRHGSYSNSRTSAVAVATAGLDGDGRSQPTKATRLHPSRSSAEPLAVVPETQVPPPSVLPTRLPKARFLTPEEVQRVEARVFAVISEVFDLDRRGWLHRQMVAAVRTLARLLYHGRVARNRIGAAYAAAVSPKALAYWIRYFHADLMWPGGRLAVFSGTRSWEAQRAERDEAERRLRAALPPAITSLLGREATEAGIVRLFASLQIPVVARSLVYVLFDLLLRRLFPGQPALGIPGIAVHGLHSPPQSVVVLGSIPRSAGGAPLRSGAPAPSGGRLKHAHRQGSRHAHVENVAAALPQRLAGAAVTAAEGMRTTVRSLSANMGAGLNLLLTGSHPAAAGVGASRPVGATSSIRSTPSGSTIQA